MNIRIYRVFLFITFITFIIFGCKEDGNGGFNDDKSSYKINNLKELCNKYASERNSDSLQAVALKLLELSKINSYDYFKANHYYVISLFGKKEYNKAIERINNVTSSKGIKEYKDLISHFNYSKARCYQFSGDYNNAIKEFNNCINDTIDNKYFDSIYNTLSNSLIQIMNSYHSSGRNNECLDYFVSLS